METHTTQYSEHTVDRMIEGVLDQVHVQDSC